MTITEQNTRFGITGPERIVTPGDGEHSRQLVQGKSWFFMLDGVEKVASVPDPDTVVVDTRITPYNSTESYIQPGQKVTLRGRDVNMHGYGLTVQRGRFTRTTLRYRQG